MHFAFGFIVFLFFLLRTIFRWGWRRGRRLSSFAKGQDVFNDLARQHGGTVQRQGWHRLIYRTQDQDVEVRLDSESRRISLRMRQQVPGHFSFYRLPRLLHAFLDAFLEPRLTLDQTHFVIGSQSFETLQTLQSRSGFVPLMQKLDEYGFSGRMNREGIRISKCILPDEINQFNVMTYIRMVRDLAQMSEPELIRIPVQQIASEQRCAYCKEMLSELEPVQYCQWCGTPHHKECFELNGKCSVYGCEQPLQVPEPAIVNQ
jgi:RING finger family protein